MSAHQQHQPLQTIPQFTKANPAYSEGSVRWLLFNREENGFNQCVVKIGKRVLIDPEKFDEWQRDQAEVNIHHSSSDKT